MNHIPSLMKAIMHKIIVTLVYYKNKIDKPESLNFINIVFTLIFYSKVIVFFFVFCSNLPYAFNLIMHFSQA